MSNPINRTVFDTRDLIDYKEQLEADILDEYITWAEDVNEHKGEEEDEDLDIPTSFDEIEFVDEEAFTTTCSDLIEEYEEIRDFCNELEDYAPDFQYGATVIHEDYFDEYCKELVEDIGDLPKNLPSYIENNIDWGGVADDLKVDYAEVYYINQTFFVR